MADQKDRFGDKLRDVEKAREDLWAAERDRELIEKMRARAATGTLLCPKCRKALVVRTQSGIAMLACPDKDGAWLDAAALKTVVAKAK